MSEPKFIPYSPLRFPEPEMIRRAREFAAMMKHRRSIREFSDRPVPREIMEACLEAVTSAPSGANRQPWHFVVVGDAATKRRIRESAEEEERAFYSGRAPQEWLKALAPLGTDARKPFLETAPWLIAIFAQSHTVLSDGAKLKNYYVSESVGIAAGVLITAVHQAGLCCLTHTPSPMAFLNRILNRPAEERPYLLLVVGYAAEDVRVPDIAKKPLGEVATFVA